MERTRPNTGNIPSTDLRRDYLAIKAEIDQAIRNVFDSGWFILGENVRDFEKEFAEYCGAGFGIGVASGTDALQLALRACDIGAGDEVITVANTAFPTAIAISYTGARPVFVDVDRTYTMDPARVEEKITARTRAIVPVHLYGQAADLEPIMSIAGKRGLRVIEDACQAHGAEYKGRKAGSIGDIGCFSFYPTKNLGAYGDGGIAITSSEELAGRLRLLRDYGQVRRYEHVEKGYNSRLDELQAAILRVKLRKLDEWNEKRRRHAMLYDKLLEGAPVVTPSCRDDARHIYHLYVVRSRQRDLLRDWLRQNGVAADIHYPTPIHLQPAYADLEMPEGSLPLTEQYASEILSLPMFPGLTDEEIERCCELIRSFPGGAHRS